MIRYAYTAWDETPGSVALAPDALLAALTNDLLHYGDLNRALSEELRRDQTSPDGAQALPGCADLQQPLQLEALLQQAGLIRRTADGLRLTPQGARQIGAKALRDIFHLMRHGWQGQHVAMRHGRLGHPLVRPRRMSLGMRLTSIWGRHSCMRSSVSRAYPCTCIPTTLKCIAANS